MSDLLELVDTHYRGLQTQDVELAVSPFADDVAIEMPPGNMSGVEALRGVVQAFVTAFPDLALTRRNTWVDGDTAIVELTFAGTHTGPLATADGEVPPTRRSLNFPLVDVFVMQDGKVAEHRVYWDNVIFLKQLGLMPGAEAS